MNFTRINFETSLIFFLDMSADDLSLIAQDIKDWEPKRTGLI